MKSFKNIRNYFFFLGLVTLFFSCQKEVEPSLADQVAGEYTGTYYTVGTTRINLPATNAAGAVATSKITVTKVGDESANFKVTFTITDKAGKATDSFQTYDGLTLKKSATGEIEGYQGATKHVTFINGELGVIVPDPTPSKTVVFYGKKN